MINYKNGKSVGLCSLRGLQCFIGLASLLGTGLCSTAQAQTTRDPWLWPFASDSIWNTPIGSSANYQPANLTNAANFLFDVEYFAKTNSSTPIRSVYNPSTAAGTFRAQGTTPSWLPNMRVPDNFLVPDITYVPYSVPNACSTLLQSDGNALIQLQPTTRTSPTGAIWGWPQTGVQAGGGILSSDGKYGTHWGSGLSAIGGTIRLNELTSAANIRHALKLEVWANKYLYYSASDPTPGYRWPARMADNYAGVASNPLHYAGTNPKLEQGALLAIPASVNLSSLGLTSTQGSKLAWTLQNFGGYIVDDTAWDAYNICIEDGVQSQWSIPQSDINKLFSALQIVDNNTSTSIGGGGTPLTATAPPMMTLAFNPGFENEQYSTPTPSSWNKTGDTNAGYTEASGPNHSGNYHYTTWRATAYNIYTYQSFPTLPNGNYTLTAWVRGNVPTGNSTMTIKKHTGPSSSVSVNIPSTPNWTKVSLSNIAVTSGQAEIGFNTNGGASQAQWIDDVEFYKQ